MLGRVKTGNILVGAENNLSRPELTGNALKLHDAELKLLQSGPLGARRLAQARSLDIQELFPEISEEHADIIGAGYVVLKFRGVQGKLTKVTRAEVNRLEN